MNLKQLIVAGMESGELTGELFVQNINSRVDDTEAVDQGEAFAVTQLTADDNGNLLVQYAGPMPVDNESE